MRLAGAILGATYGTVAALVALYAVCHPLGLVAAVLVALAIAREAYR